MGIKQGLMLSFTCKDCGTVRPYGNANGLNEHPHNLQPTIGCAGCKKATVHLFGKSEMYRMSYDRNAFGAIENVSFAAIG